jgi:hypothetical protein
VIGRPPYGMELRPPYRSQSGEVASLDPDASVKLTIINSNEAFDAVISIRSIHLVEHR